mgnify:FL=1
MSRLNRFYIAGAHAPGDTLQLDAERSNYLCRALRMGDDDERDIYDGVGGLYRCKVSHAHQRRAKVEVLERPSPVAKPENAPSLAIALLKGQAMDRAIQQATELGAQRIWLLQGARSNLTLKQERLEQKLDHWQRIIASACEQCGQLWLPRLHEPRTVADCLEQQIDEVQPIVFEPEGDPMPPRLEVNNPLIFVGPEGGWNDEEKHLFQDKRAATYRLGSTILRAETRPAVGIALVQQARGWSG